MIRAERTCHLDLRCWGFKHDKNTAKPYWAGHERSDVVEARNVFVQKFLTNKDNYYLINEGEDPSWISPKNNPTILLCKCFIGFNLSLP